jgi:pyruvate/2-oxoglutarate dehydrogenase complex dihydrolipoamide dehydrogenase (E3) component
LISDRDTLVEGDSGRILGAHLVQPHADEVINLFGLAIRHNLTAGDLKTTMFAYPTAQRGARAHNEGNRRPLRVQCKR